VSDFIKNFNLNYCPMKTKTFLLMILFIATTCMLHAQKGYNHLGTWKLIQSSGNALPEGYTNIKMITPTHFIWVMSDKEGNIISGASGTYTMIGDTYTETILYTLPGMKAWKGKKAFYQVEFNDNIMKTSGYLEYDSQKKIPNSEVWEKND
jgi:hypothetical protein